MKTFPFLIKWTGLHNILFLPCQLFPLSFLLFLSCQLFPHSFWPFLSCLLFPHSFLLILSCQLFLCSDLPFLLLSPLICFIQSILSLCLILYLIPFRLPMPDLSFENFYRFHRRLELRIKRIFNTQDLELFLTVQFRLLAQQHPVFGSHGHHHLVKAVDWRILFPRDACVWLITRQNGLRLLCRLVSLRRLVSQRHHIFLCHLLPLYHHMLQLSFVQQYCLVHLYRFVFLFNCAP